MTNASSTFSIQHSAFNPMTLLTGNLVLPYEVCFGELVIADGLISAITPLGTPQPDAPLILPGFIDLHFHGLGPYSAEDPRTLLDMAAFAPQVGMTSFCPTLAPTPWPDQLAYVRQAKEAALVQHAGARCLGTHLEGPFIAPAAKGGMNEDFLRPASLDDLRALLREADGTLRLLTLSPELPGALDVIAEAVKHGVRVAIGHTHCTIDDFQKAVEAGARQVCHLFDTFEGRPVHGGVSQTCLTDAILIEDRVDVEIIPDGHHVPPGLIELTRRAAGPDRIIAITDAMMGAGLPDGVYAESDGRPYRLTNGDVCRLTDGTGIIVGSCLTPHTAFRNLTKRFGFPIPEASRMLSANPARALSLHDQTGALQEGLWADITILSPDHTTVSRCLVSGKTAFANDDAMT